MQAKKSAYAEELAAEKEFQAAEPLPAKLTGTALYSIWRPRSFCFTGGKGGVGKTAMLLRAADYLRRYNYAVRIIDCDPLPKAYRQATNKLTYTNEKSELPNGAVAHTLWSSNTNYELIKYDLQDKPFAESFYTYGELNALAKQAQHGAKDAVLKLLINLDRQIQKEADPGGIILYDCAAGLEFTSTLPYFLATYFFVVTNPELPALQDAASIVKMIAQNEQMAKNIYPVINKIPVQDKKSLLLAKKITDQALSNMRLLFGQWAKTSNSANFASDTIYVAASKNPASINAERLGQKILELLNPAERP
ncbi:MAG: AAA family ATPase [Candidatus Margulisbacteria bacterium]|jgi:MinD-like ATPase involved in chromosome partitioning or flagellar assembly|nr:AAA family ATPase [Candidatus Margulisiibacteriota bacterium]